MARRGANQAPTAFFLEMAVIERLPD